MEDQQLNETDRCAAPSDTTKCHGVEESSERLASRSRGSPLALWPRRDSPRTKTVQASGYHEDNHSFALFSSSFDTLSEPGNYLRETAPHERYTFAATPLSPATGRSNRNQDSNNRGIDITLPDLKHDAEESDYSLGDMSPIKLIYGGPTAANQGRRLETEVMVHPLPTAREGGQGSQWGPIDQYVQGSASNPFYVIRSSVRAFDNCRYLLSCLRGADICPVHISEFGHIRHYKGLEADRTVSDDLKIAIRRVEAAVCAFGGNVNTEMRYKANSIFRLKGPSNARLLYEQRLPYRYYLSGSRISWEVEENPPVWIVVESEEGRDASTPGGGKRQKRYHSDSPHSHCDGRGQRSGVSTPSLSHSATPDETDTDGSKMKYRCKLCGQPKQNHNCPYRQFLQRSIGVMVYPAVNSFTAAEPGTIAPPLSKMNNFVSYDLDHGSPEPEYTGAALSRHGESTQINLNTVTPEAFRAGGAYYHSPQSSLSVTSEKGTPPPPPVLGAKAHVCVAEDVSNDSCGKRQLSHSQGGAERDSATQRSPFVASVALRQEHYRAVTPSQPGEDCSTAYQYPVVPLTFAERKRMSETLFHLSRDIPTLTSDCAAALRVARKNNEWDLAVAELLTQVVVGLYCVEGDSRLDGLQQYLLALGVSC